MALDLEVAGVVRELAEGEALPASRAPEVKRLRDSHHALARLLARGLTPAQASQQTGYSASRISTLQLDPAFQELLSHYRRDADNVSQEVEARFLMIAGDAAQVVHERLLDEGDEVPLVQALEVFKVFADRAGFAPIQRSVNKNLNLNIGERLDRARARRDAAE